VSHDTASKAVVAETTWKSSGAAVLLNVNSAYWRRKGRTQNVCTLTYLLSKILCVEMLLSCHSEAGSCNPVRSCQGQANIPEL
jgi:hypothetical protein